MASDRHAVVKEAIVNVGDRLEIVFVEGRTFRRTAHAGAYRVFIGDEDPNIDAVGVDELWLVELVEFVRSDLWRVSPIERRADADSLVQDVEQYRYREIAPSERHLGKETPEFLANVLVALPGLITVSFKWEDEKGIFGQHGGIVIRPAHAPRWAVKPLLGGTYLVAPKSSGTRGIYAEPVASVCSPKGDTRVPGVFEAQFVAHDRWGIYAEFGDFRVRPDRTWKECPQVGETHRVWPVSVLRANCRVIFVLPVGHPAPSWHPRAAESVQ